MDRGLSGSAIASAVAVSSASWTGLFGLVCFLQPHRSYSWNGRTVACIHGVTVSIMSLVFGIWINPSPFTDPGGVSNVYEILVQVTCLGFFFVDTTLCLTFNVYGHETYIMAVHHVVVMVGMMTSLWMGVSGTEISAAIFLGECTNPMFQLRWFMRESGMRKTNTWYELNDLVFVVSFVVIRGAIMQYLAYCEITHPQPADTFKFFGVSFCVMNCILVVGIMQFAVKKYAALFRDWRRGDTGDEAKQGSQLEGNSQKQLSNGPTTFEEITLHTSLGLTVKNIKHRLVMKYPKI